MLVGILIAVTLLGQNQRLADSYAVHLQPNTMRGACRALDPSAVRNLAFPFRANVYPGQRLVQFKDGRYEDRWEISGGKIEWTMEIEKQEPIFLGRDSAVLLKFFANHMAGSGSSSHVLVVRCKEGRFQVVFEAGGEAVDFIARENEIQITHPVRTAARPSVAPNSEAIENYRWDPARDRFGLKRDAGK